MSSERTEDVPGPSPSRNRPSDGGRDTETTGNGASSESGGRQDSTAARNDEAQDGDANRDKKPEPAPKEVSVAKIKMRSRLPALEDDAEGGVQKEQIVTRDGKADLAFTGTLLASAAPACAPKGHWEEYRIYQTTGAKHVFSKVTRSIYLEEEDVYEAEVFDPTPSSVPSQLLRGAREIARARPITWMDAAVAFFGYDPLAKVLYRKLSVRFEEQIS
jgi:hypothetical protein